MLKKIWVGWKKVAEKIGNFQATVIFSLLFFILVTPFGLVMRLFSNPIKVSSKSGWIDVVDNTSSLQKLSKQ